MSARRPATPSRDSVDLSGFPELVVVYLGYRARSARGLLSLARIGRGLQSIARHPPEGLLLHETLWFGVTHPGFRQYWRDLDSLERFTRAPQHAAWWRDFRRDTGGGGIWHETYRMRGGMEAIYSDMPPIGLAGFAPRRAPEGGYNSARQRLADVAVSGGDPASGHPEPGPAR